MHIFQNLRTPETIKLEEDRTIAKNRGISLEEYRALKKKEYDEKYRRIHDEELKRLDISEEEYQKRNKKKELKEKKLGYVTGTFFTIFMASVLFLIYYGIPAFLSSSEIGKGILIVVGIIFVVGLIAFYLCTPVFLTIWAFLNRGKGNRYLKALVAILLMLFVVGLVLYTCGSWDNGSTEIYEPGKLRPDKF